LNNQPPCASIAERNTASWAASAARIASASFSHRRVDPSTSVAFPPETVVSEAGVDEGVKEVAKVQWRQLVSDMLRQFVVQNIGVHREAGRRSG
jgi:hypothetical protein